MPARAAVARHRSTLASIVLLVLAITVVVVGRADATHRPADKVAATSNIDDIVFIAPEQGVLLLQEQFRTSTTSDLLLHISSECSIVTEVTTVGNDAQYARGQLRYYLTMSTDGGPEQPVGVTQTSSHPTEPGHGDDGSVVFCDRMYERETTLFDDEDATIRTYMETRSANAFNWVQLNAGRGIHTVKLYATFTPAETETGRAQGVVGRRTMIIEPVKAKNDEQVSDLVVD